MRTRRSQSSSNPMPSGQEGLPAQAGQPAQAGHRTVLLHEAIEQLSIQKSDTVVDATLGGAGHSRAILEALGTNGTLVGFDADAEAIERARELLGGDARVRLVHSNFRHLSEELRERGIELIDKALFDLGWSSFQLSAGRGFSFQSDEPLSMAYDSGQSLTASTIVNEWGEESLADIIFGWGEDRYARRIAKAIVDARALCEIRTARQLAEIIRGAYPAPARFGRIHPATKTFQALRIAVNDELGSLDEALKSAWRMLRSGGRIAVITFHSIEDRIVKRRFASWEAEEAGKRITRKPIVPSEKELTENPRARSAKLRVIQKI